MDLLQQVKLILKKNNFLYFVFKGALYDVVGFEWSTMFTVGWNAAVFIVALSSLLAVGINKFASNNTRKQYLYTVLEGDNKSKEVNNCTGDDQVNQTDG